MKRMSWLVLLVVLAAAPAWAQEATPSAGAPPPRIPLILKSLASEATTEAARDDAAEPSDLLTLDEAVSLALKQNRQVKNATLAVGITGDRIAAARTNMFPQMLVKVTPSYRLTPIDLNFEQGAFGNSPPFGPIPAQNTTLTTNPGYSTGVQAGVTQPLSQLYAIGLSVAQLGVARDMSREDLRSQRLSTVNTVKQQYYAVLESQSALEALEEQVAANRELVRVLTEQASQEVALPSSVLQARLALSQSEHNARSTRHTLASQKEQLNVSLGRDPVTPFRVTPGPDVTSLQTDLGAARDSALRQRPDLQRAKLQATHADYGVRLGWAAYIPDVSFVFRYTSSVTAEQLPKNITYAGVEFSWDIFDWGKKQRRLAESKKALEQAKNAAEDAASQVVLEVNAAFRKLEDAQSFLKVSALGRDYARESLRETTDQFKHQAVLLKDLLAAQAALGRASDQYRQAVLSYWEARAYFDRAVGADQ
jgi:outer membrane protein TolC